MILKKKSYINAVFSQRKGAFKNIFTQNTFTHSAFILIATPKDILVNSNPYNVTRLPPIKSHTPEAKESPQCLFSDTLSHCQCLYNANLCQQVPPSPYPQSTGSPVPYCVYTKPPTPRDVYDLCVLITYQNTCWTHVQINEMRKKLHLWGMGCS